MKTVSSNVSLIADSKRAFGSIGKIYFQCTLARYCSISVERDPADSHYFSVDSINAMKTSTQLLQQSAPLQSYDFIIGSHNWPSSLSARPLLNVVADWLSSLAMKMADSRHIFRSDDDICSPWTFQNCSSRVLHLHIKLNAMRQKEVWCWK